MRVMTSPLDFDRLRFLHDVVVCEYESIRTNDKSRAQRLCLPLSLGHIPEKALKKILQTRLGTRKGGQCPPSRWEWWNY